MAFIMSWNGSGDVDGARVAAGRLARFRRELYFSFGLRRDALFDVADALACGQERVLMLAQLSLEPECRRGHGGVFDALNSGDVVIGRLRLALDAVPLPAWDDGRIRLAADVSNWLDGFDPLQLTLVLTLVISAVVLLVLLRSNRRPQDETDSA